MPRAWRQRPHPTGRKSVSSRTRFLGASQTQSLTDAELHYIIDGVQLTGMPAFTDLHEVSPRGAWLVVLYVRNLAAQNQEQKRAHTPPQVHQFTSLARKLASSATRKSTSVGRKPPRLTWCAIRASI